MVDVEFDVELSMVHSWQYHAEYLYQNYESILVIAIAYSYMHCAAGSRHALHGWLNFTSLFSLLTDETSNLHNDIHIIAFN